MDELADVDVLQVITTTIRRGAERFAVALEPELEARGFSVRTVALCPGSGPGLDVATLGSSRLGGPTLRALRKQASTAQVVIAHGSTTLPATALATVGHSTPFVYRNIGDPYFWMNSVRRRATSRWCLGRASAVVSLTEETKRRLVEVVKIPADRVTAIPRGVAAEDFPPRDSGSRAEMRDELGLDNDAMLAICLGAMSPEKAIDDAVLMLEHLPPRWNLALVGDGPTRREVAEAAALVGPGRVSILGERSDPERVLAGGDVLVLPSLTEGLPGVVIEAAMVGLPAVATRVGFIEEIVTEGLTGYLVDPGDPKALASSLLTAEPNLVQMGHRAQQQVGEKYSLQSVADAWAKVLTPFVDGCS